MVELRGNRRGLLAQVPHRIAIPRIETVAYEPKPPPWSDSEDRERLYAEVQWSVEHGVAGNQHDDRFQGDDAVVV